MFAFANIVSISARMGRSCVGFVLRMLGTTLLWGGGGVVIFCLLLLVRVHQRTTVMHFGLGAHTIRGVDAEEFSYSLSAWCIF